MEDMVLQTSWSVQQYGGSKRLVTMKPLPQSQVGSLLHHKAARDTRTRSAPIYTANVLEYGPHEKQVNQQDAIILLVWSSN